MPVAGHGFRQASERRIVRGAAAKRFSALLAALILAAPVVACARERSVRPGTAQPAPTPAEAGSRTDRTAGDRAAGRPGAHRDGVQRFPGTAAPGSGPDFEISISRVANLVHWIDNLAGSSQGKTVRAYRQYWSRRFGTPTEAEMDLLRDWVEIRWKIVPRPEPEIVNAGGCLPQVRDAPDWRRTFRLRSYEAPSIEAFVTTMSADLTKEETAALRRVLEAFRPRFDEAWDGMTFLTYFKERFERFLGEGGLRAYLGEVAAFFGVDPAAHPRGRIHLMALPEEGPTHAQADGRDLLMEIRPNDTPIEQIQVIAHETSHYLWSLVPPGENDALARQVHAAGRRGPLVWSLLREGLPTALGQGLAEARLAPSRFGEHHSWYHVGVVDRFAKGIYPVVAKAFEERRRLEDGVMAEIARRSESHPDLAAAPPSTHLTQSFFAVGEKMWEAYADIRRSARVHSGYPYDLRSPEAAAFAAAYECLSGVVLLGPEEMKEPARLPEIFRPPATGPSMAGRSFIQAVRRPAGGSIIFLVAAGAGDAPGIGRAFLDLTAWPEEPVLLPDAPTASSPPPPPRGARETASMPPSGPAPSP